MSFTISKWLKKYYFMQFPFKVKFCSHFKSVIKGKMLSTLILFLFFISKNILKVFNNLYCTVHSFVWQKWQEIAYYKAKN